MNRNTNILVIGSAGFIGSNFVWMMLLEYLDCFVVNLDKLIYAGNLENLKVIELILNRLNRPKSLIKHVTDRPGHDRRYAIDASKIITQLSWKPSVTFGEGVNKTINWYLEHEKWLSNVLSGDYQNNYKSMYNGR